jgi:hypothetical protein
MLKTIPLKGVIYLYKNKNTGKNLYVGQSYQFDKRIKDHIRMNRTRADIKLREIGEENIEILILHEKIFNEYADNKQNREAYQIWANQMEKEEIKNYDTYENGLNGTKGGQHDNQKDAFTEWSHKLSMEFFEIFIKAAKIYIQKENNILGACPRNYILMEMNNYKLGEELHKFRSNEYKTIWADEECVKLLNEVGYTKTSKDAGVVASDRWGKSRIDNKWEKIKLILEWIYKEYEHINLTQGSDNPDNFTNELLEGLNYKKISQIIFDIRSGNVVGNDNERKEFLKSLNYFETDYKFQDHKFIIGMKWYYENFNFSYPQQCIVIPNNTKLPKYMIDFNIGTFYANRTKSNTIPNEIKELIKKNKNKPRPSLKDHYKDNPDKYKEMCSKLEEAHSKVSPLSYKIRSWNEILKRKFEPLKITNYKLDKKNAKQFVVSCNHFTFSSIGNNKYFRASKYNTFYECYLEAKKHKILSFYSRKWYIKTFIKGAKLELENENFTPIETNKREKKTKISGQKFKIQFDITLQKFNHFYDLNKKIPSEKSKNIDEKKLGSWYSNNLHYYRHNINYNHKEEFEKLLTNINMPFIIM